MRVWPCSRCGSPVAIRSDASDNIVCPQCGLVTTPPLKSSQDRSSSDSQQPTPTRATEPFSRAALIHNDLAAELQSMTGPPEQPDELGRLGPYRLLQILGGGGMGIVVEAEDCQLKRRVALKVMRANL